MANVQLHKIVEDFVHNLSAEIERQKREEIAGIVLGAVSGGRAGARKAHGRRKGPIQLCPVPRCKKRAAPVFHMVCGDHKDLPKTKIAKYREERRRAKNR